MKETVHVAQFCYSFFGLQQTSQLLEYFTITCIKHFKHNVYFFYLRSFI